MSVAFGPEGRIAAAYGVHGGVGGVGVVLFDARGERLRPALEVKEGDVTSVAFGPEGQIAAVYGVNGPGGGVVLFDADPSLWLRKAGQAANRNFTPLEWTHYFPETAYRRTIRSCPSRISCPTKRKKAEAWEKEHPRGKRPHDAICSETKHRPDTLPGSVTLGNSRRGWSFARPPGPLRFPKFCA